MPLYEFLRLARGKLESAQQKTQSHTDLSSVAENDLVELVWENGQIMMQGQSNRAKKNPNLNDFPSQKPGIRERYTGNVTTPKVGKLGGIDSTLNDAPPSAPSGERDLNQEDEMGPWLNYSVDDGFRSDFCSEVLPEISGVTGNVTSSLNSFAAMGKGSCNELLQHSHTVPVHNGVDLELRNASKVSSSIMGLLSPYSSQQCQISVPSAGSGVSSIVMNTSTSNNPDAFFGDSVQDQASSGGSISMKMQKQKVGLPGRASSRLNFSGFSRPAALFRANLEKTDGLAASCSSGIEKMGVEKVSAASITTAIKPTQVKPSSNSQKDICFHNQPKLFSTKVDSRLSVVKPSEKSCSVLRSDVLHRKDLVKNDKSSSPVICPSTTKEKDGENPVEPIDAASSVCSGNSGEGDSNDQTHTLKRKHRDNEESESRSDDIEEESMGIKKAAHARGGSGSKRSRAAEVHNLSERRRRDRINEKMRALQELIPNCNKADKASMLDEAIEYLKTLQLQVQMMSMGPGLCMPPMMFPTGLQHMHTAYVPLPPMGGGMGMGMGLRMGMLDMNSGSPRFPIFPVPPMQGAHFPSPPISGSYTFQGISGSNLQVFGHPGQGLPMSAPRAPFVPLLGQAPIRSAVGLNASSMGIHVEAPNASPTFKFDVAVHNKNSQLIHNADTGSSVDQTSSQLQATNKDFDQSAMTSKDDQAPDVRGAASVNLASKTDVVSTKEVGSD